MDKIRSILHIFRDDYPSSKDRSWAVDLKDGSRLVKDVEEEPYPANADEQTRADWDERQIAATMSSWEHLYVDEAKIIRWCFGHEANEFTFQCQAETDPMKAVFHEMKKCAPGALLARFKDDIRKANEESSRNPPIHTTREVPQDLAPFYIGVRNRAIFHPYHGSTKCHNVNVYRLDEESTKYISEDPLGDFVLYRKGVFMFGMINHEDEGILVINGSELPSFEKIDIPWRSAPEWVGYDQFEPTAAS